MVAHHVARFSGLRRMAFARPRAWWRTTDLVWSLWLSSLLVGYAMIFWGIFGPILAMVCGTRPAGEPLARQWIGGAVLAGGGLFILAFFTIHFGGFHFVHSVFLYSFFPVTPGMKFPSLAAYAEIFRRYWPFVLLAALAERQAFRWALRPDSKSPKTGSPAARPSVASKVSAPRIAEPYLNVVRMHLLIFFFVSAKTVHMENALVYVVVYAVYFFPWRVLRRRPRAAEHKGVGR